MKFCNSCENKLSPIEENSSLWNKCTNCGFKEKYEDSIIDVKNYKNKNTVSSDNNKYLIYDNTIPRTIHKVCPNKSCITVKNPELQEVIFIQNPVTIKLIYICTRCNTEWKYS